MSAKTDIKDILKAVQSVSQLGDAMASIFSRNEDKELRKNFRIIWKYYRKTRRKLKRGGLTEEEKTELKQIKTTVNKALDKLV